VVEGGVLSHRQRAHVGLDGGHLLPLVTAPPVHDEEERREVTGHQPPDHLVIRMRRSLQLLRQFETRSTFNVSQTLLAPFATIGPWSATASGCCGLPVQYLPLNEARPVPTATCTPRAFGPNPYLCYMIDWRSPPFSLIAGHYSLSRETTSGLPLSYSRKPESSHSARHEGVPTRCRCGTAGTRRAWTGVFSCRSGSPSLAARSRAHPPPPSSCVSLNQPG
jgi:hypothetical protein